MGLVLGLLQSDFSFRINSALFPLLPVLLGTTKVEKNRDLGAIASWGPTFRVSVDLIINSYGSGNQYRNIISFKGNNGNNCCNNGDRVPAFWSHPREGRLSTKNSELDFIGFGSLLAVLVCLLKATKPSQARHRQALCKFFRQTENIKI